MNLKPKMNQFLTTDMINAVRAYLLATTNAELMREKVDTIAAEVLQNGKYFEEEKTRRGVVRGGDRITEPKNAWLMDDKSFKSYHAEMDKRERAAGIKPAEMDYDFCPALIAEDIQRKAVRIIIDLAGEIFEADDWGYSLLCAGGNKYDEFLELTVKMVVSSPKFKK